MFVTIPLKVPMGLAKGYAMIQKTGEEGYVRETVVKESPTAFLDV